MGLSVAAFQHGVYPRSEDVVAATRGRERGRNSQDDVERAFASDRQNFLEVQQEAGLDYFSDGLLRWQDIFRPFVEMCHGLDAHTLVRWFDNNSFFRAPEVTGELRLSPGVPKQMEDDRDIPEPKLATLPSPYLFSRAAKTEEVDRNALMRDLTREILRPLAQELSGRGYRLLHLQEPWLVYFGTDRGDWDDFEKAVGEIREVTEGVTLVLNTYFGDAGPYVDRLRRLPVDAVGIDFVETDVDELGTKWEVGLLAGVLDGRRSPIEPVEPTVEFARRAVETLGAPSLFVSSNSELELLPRDIARRKVLRLGEISAQLKDLLR
jgi:5-methyltetrahydropteroyltriglutamate--homocysteine methyltransferase